MLGVIKRLSPRERMLGAVALMLVLVLGLVYGGLMPGMAAARSAAVRNADAEIELSVIRSLAPAATTGAASTVDTGALQQSAEAAGLVIVDQRAVDGGVMMTVTASDARGVLRWLTANAGVAAIESFVVDAASTGGVTANVQFRGTAS